MLMWSVSQSVVAQWSWTSVGDSHQLPAHSTPPSSLPNPRSQEERWCGGCKTRGSADSSWILGLQPAARMEWRQQLYGKTFTLQKRHTWVYLGLSIECIKSLIKLKLFSCQLCISKQSCVLFVHYIWWLHCKSLSLQVFFCGVVCHACEDKTIL